MVRGETRHAVAAYKYGYRGCLQGLAYIFEGHVNTRTCFRWFIMSVWIKLKFIYKYYSITK